MLTTSVNGIWNWNFNVVLVYVPTGRWKEFYDTYSRFDTVQQRDVRTDKQKSYVEYRAVSILTLGENGFKRRRRVVGIYDTDLSVFPEITPQPDASDIEIACSLFPRTFLNIGINVSRM